jgi:alpha-N-arabinofuranosidase
VGNNPDLAAKIPNTRGIRNDVVAALRKIRIPNLRWPGGCFADEYHWRDGIGPREARPQMVNTHWGGVTEDNSFGTHEFLDLCEQLHCEPYICGNVGSGTVQELSQWVEYANFNGISPTAELRRKNGRDKPWDVRYWGIGNESWGCGGNMSAAFYAGNYRRYATYARNYNGPLYKIACGPSNADYDWTRTLMEKAGKQMQGLSLHYYTVPGEWESKGRATEFNEAVWKSTMRKAYFADMLINKHSAIMDEFDPARKTGLVMDEWGAWYDVEPGTNPGFLYQQNTLRDALVAAIHFNIFNNHAERLHMANIAQTINVLQSVILTDGPAMVLTPTYHVFDMYQVHQDALLLPLHVESDEAANGLPAISASASEDGAGSIHISLANADPAKEQAVSLELRGFSLSASAKISGSSITADTMQAHNTFEKPGAVALKLFNGATVSGGKLVLTLPPMSVVTVELA